MDRRPLEDRLYDSKYVMTWHDQIGHEVQTQIVEPKDKLIAEMRHALTVIAEACEEQIGDHHLGFEIADPMKFCEATRKIARTALEEK